jgi:hypothetical protein
MYSYLESIIYFPPFGFHQKFSSLSIKNISHKLFTLIAWTLNLFLNLIKPSTVPNFTMLAQTTISANSFLISHKPFSQSNPLLFTNPFTNHALTQNFKKGEHRAMLNMRSLILLDSCFSGCFINCSLSWLGLVEGEDGGFGEIVTTSETKKKELNDSNKIWLTMELSEWWNH